MGKVRVVRGCMCLIHALLSPIPVEATLKKEAVCVLLSKPDNEKI